MPVLPKVCRLLCTITLLCGCAIAQEAKTATVAELVDAVRSKAKVLENSRGMRQGFVEFTAAYRLKPETVIYSDYVRARLLYEATRDAGFWNMHWTITDRQPVSDNVWRQWKDVRSPSYTRWTAAAECDELSALYAFLVHAAGVHGVGLFWPYSNHTVAAWVLRPERGKEVRVVVPTSQIFLQSSDTFGTTKFDPWKQKGIFEYKRQDVPDSYQIPRPLFDLFVVQLEKYGGASDLTLQQLRYLREAVFLKSMTAEQAAREALHRRDRLKSSLPAEDLAAFENFARDMRAG